MACANQLGTKGTQLDLLVRQGGTFGPYTITITDENANPIDITNNTFTGQIRKTAASTTITAAIVSTVINGPMGNVQITIPSTVTSTIICGDSEKDDLSLYVWDFEMMDSLGNIIPLFFGNVQVFREVTR